MATESNNKPSVQRAGNALMVDLEALSPMMRNKIESLFRTEGIRTRADALTMSEGEAKTEMMAWAESALGIAKELRAYSEGR